jgi:hypothetical protein
MKKTEYCGWKIVYTSAGPHTGMVVASKHGVEMRADSYELLCAMIDERRKDERLIVK